MVVVAAERLRKGYAGAVKTPAKPKLRLVTDDDTGITPYRGTELRQTRQNYDPIEMDRLKSSIDRRELINPVQIAQLQEAEARHYLHIWNRVWGTRYKLSQISQVNGRYEIVVAGHRRKRAGIELCKEGRPPRNWNIKFLPDIAPEEALEIQFQENVYSAPETWEDADAVYRLWAFYQEIERKQARDAKRRGEEFKSDLTLKGFSERVGRSPGTVRDYIRFGSAPKVLQTAVRTSKIAYGKGVLLARAHASGAISLELLQDHWLPLASLPGQAVTVFENAMKARIAKARNQQDDLFGDLDVTDVTQAYQSERKAVVYPEYINRIHETLAYLAVVRELDEAGCFGENGSYSDASPNRVVQKLVDEIEKTLPHLRRMTAGRLQHNLRVLTEAGALLNELAEISLTAPPVPLSHGFS